MSSISFASGALVLAVSLVASTMACIGAEDNAGSDPSALSNERVKPNDGSSDTDLGVFGDLSACGTINTSLLVGASCEVVVDADASVMCIPVHMGLSGYAECALSCDASAGLACKAECGLDCLTDCNANLDLDAAATCESSCRLDAAAACSASFKEYKYSSQVACEAAAFAGCDAECHVCSKIEASAGCSVKCDAACDASCQARANLDCQLDCQADLRATLKASCEADLKGKGALFCDNAYIYGAVDVNACLKALLAFKG